jgi:hypothetical protein
MASTAKWAVSTITLHSRYVTLVMSAQKPGLWELSAVANSANGQVGGLTALGAIAGAAALGLDFLNIPSFISLGLASVVAGNVDSVPALVALAKVVFTESCPAGVAARYYPFYAAWRKEQRRVAEEALQKQQAQYVPIPITPYAYRVLIHTFCQLLVGE